ncbi:type II secretion system protein [Akkermansiaceae bacterium]|nr:type II secretion system protein [Akkermansiaceae bacterium]
MMKPVRKHLARRGMTLMEVVIAIGLVAFVVPIILTMTATTGNNRRNAEADTRSAWLAREVQRQVLSKWAEPVRESFITASPGFPAFASEASPLVLAFDSAGTFISEGGAQDLSASSKIPKASYLVTVYGEAHTPAGTGNAPDLFSLLRIRILHPAKSAPAARSVFRYNLITTRQGTL